MYKQHEFNRSTRLINWQSKPLKKCKHSFPIRTSSCFPDMAPIDCTPPMRYRPVGGTRVLTENEIKRPTAKIDDKRELNKAFTFKLKLKNKVKDE